MLSLLPFKLQDVLFLAAGLIVGMAFNLNININNGDGKQQVRSDAVPSFVTWSGCPSGWKDTSVQTDAVRAYTCEKGDYAIVYNERGDCDRGRRINPPEAVWRLCAEVPGWTGK